MCCWEGEALGQQVMLAGDSLKRSAWVGKQSGRPATGTIKTTLSIAWHAGCESIALLANLCVFPQRKAPTKEPPGTVASAAYATPLKASPCSGRAAAAEAVCGNVSVCVPPVRQPSSNTENTCFI